MLRKFMSILLLVSLVSPHLVAPVQAAPTNPVDPVLAKQAMNVYVTILKRKQQKIFNREVVKSAKVLKVMEIPKDQLKAVKEASYLNNKKYRFVYAAIEYDMERESKYMLNGINFMLAVIQPLGREWEVVGDEYEIAPVPYFLENGIGFGKSINNEEDRRIAAAEIQMASILKKHQDGIYVDYEGKTVPDYSMHNIATPSQLKEEMSGSAAAFGALSEESPGEINASYKRPRYIRVIMKDERNLKYYGCAGDDQCVKVLDFLDYCKHVLPNEWDEHAPDESLKTGAMAVKMYAWYKVAVTPSAQVGEADVYDSTRDQKFLADLSTIGKKPEDIAHMQSMFHVDDIAGAGFKDNMGNLILAEYRAESSGKASGLVSQKYSTNLAKQGMHFDEILRYYFDKSPKTMDKGTINFFHYTR
ncbi:MULTISPECIES: SpoIID/LytB domain-containing protein [Paenibacillus]|uniref:SpoIID/LytB domain-containing protein n=2 Tax=Paenibacillus TaxID=44249 RepID=UPI00096E9219|nr:SpoIID/LytB domain-containing protein [Paenibacillus sp. FSL H8-0259]OMF25117.1 hypothetical protein BK132_22860 [Paenibacillus sp. FSL H8-0259]